MGVNLKTEKEIWIMREGGSILSKILKELSVAVRPGITTARLNELAIELVFKFGVKASFLDYGGFPAVLCTSVNDEIVHGVPSERKLKEGDILTLDMGVLHKGFNTDSAITVLVSERLRLSHIFKKDYARKIKLINTTKRALKIGIEQARPGNTVGNIGSAIQKYVEAQGFGVVRDLVGHGVGRELHEEPQVPNYGKPGQGPKLVEGMVIAIEPMVVTGDIRAEEGPDGFVFQTKDGGLAVHFEHTVAITEKDPLVLTH